MERVGFFGIKGSAWSEIVRRVEGRLANDEHFLPKMGALKNGLVK